MRKSVLHFGKLSDIVFFRTRIVTAWQAKPIRVLPAFFSFFFRDDGAEDETSGYLTDL